ncbi:MAG: hypothetical protein ACRC5M_04460 [Anaeroplasmataceae bacterium]
MVKKLVQGKTYYLPFISPYTKKGPYSVKISAIAKKSTLDIYGNFDIRGTFFDEVGIKTYLTMVDDETNIYICHEVKSYDPIDIDVGGFIFIPESIIDFGKVDEYKVASRIAFTIDGVRRQYDSNSEMNKFISDLESSIPNAVANETILANDIISLSNTQEEILVRDSVLKLEEQGRDEYIKARQNKISLMRKQESEREMDYYKRLKDLENRENTIAIKEKIIDQNLKFSETSKIVSNKWLIYSNDLIQRINFIYGIVVEASIQASLPVMTWEDLLLRIYSPAHGGVDLEAWKELVNDFMISGNIPDEWKDLDWSHCPICNTEIDDIIASGTDI